MEPEKEFIMSLESLPLLWDKTHRFYVNKYKRNEALEKLSHILKKKKPSASIEDVKKKINTLRSNYRRELKKIEVSQRSGADIYRPKCWNFEYLHFLNKFEKPQIHGSDNEEDGSEVPKPMTISQDASTSKPPASKPSASISSVTAVPLPSPPVTEVQKCLINTHNELLNKAIAHLMESGTKANSSNSIASDWAETLDRLEPTQKLFAKKAINDVLFEAELGSLHRHSVQINVPLISPKITYKQSISTSSSNLHEIKSQQYNSEAAAATTSLQKQSLDIV